MLLDQDDRLGLRVSQATRFLLRYIHHLPQLPHTPSPGRGQMDSSSSIFSTVGRFSGASAADIALPNTPQVVGEMATATSQRPCPCRLSP